MAIIIENPIGKIEIAGVNMDSLHDYAVKAFNNEISTFQEVMGVLMLSCGYERETAYRYTIKIHKEGSAICYWNSKDKCQKVVQAFTKIGVKAEVIDNQ